MTREAEDVNLSRRKPSGHLEIRKATQHPIAAGETLRVRSGGGGGYGPPAERDPDAVRRDVAEGYVSAEAAQRDYRSSRVVNAPSPASFMLMTPMPSVRTCFVCVTTSLTFPGPFVL